jgi:tetratricopeptide repeat protein 8
MTLSCFEKALAIAEDDTIGDIWYNIAHVAIGIGDLSLAFQALKICIASDPQHAEALNNLGV